MRDLASHAIDVTRTVRLDVSRLTDAGLMNVRFRTLETEDEGGNIVRLTSSLWNPYKQPSNLAGTKVFTTTPIRKLISAPIGVQQP